MSSSAKLFPKDYWAMPQLDPARPGDGNHVTILMAVGHALTCWETVEDTLGSLMLCLSKERGANHLELIRRLFGNVESSSQRLKMIRIAAALYFEPYEQRLEIGNPLSDLLRNVSDAARRRNEFAHGRLVTPSSHGLNKDGSPNIVEKGAFLISPAYAIERNRPYTSQLDPDDPFLLIRSKYRYTSVDIVSFAGKFSELNHAILTYMSSIQLINGTPKNVLELLIKEASLEESSLGKSKNVPQQKY